MTWLAAITMCMVLTISEEKGWSLEKAEDIVVDCIKDGMKTVKE